MSQVTYLIVEQHLNPPKNFSEILKTLAHKFNLDIYLCRQRLTGRGLSLLSKGELKTLKPIADYLQQVGISHWIVEPSKPGFVPPKVRKLTISSDKIIFGCQKGDVVFRKGSTFLAIFAETSGILADKSVTQLLSSHAYRGKDDIRHLTDTKIHKIILQGSPILDLYQLNEKMIIESGVRVFPGKFDPKGLGERASLSSKQNLQQILKLAEEYAGKFKLHTDFGLVNLPGCTLRRDDPDNPETRRQNLIRLARYGWLMADVLKVDSQRPRPEKDLDQTDLVTATILTQSPAIAGTASSADILPVINEIGHEIEADERSEDKHISPETATAGLPAPPPAKSGPGWSSPTFWLGSAGAAAAAVIMFLANLNAGDLLNKFAYHAFASGALSALVAGAMFSYGFYFLRMRRQIENTPTSKIRSIAMGMVEVKGEAVRKYALISPMSQTPCVFYRLTKYKRRARDHQWRVTSVSSSNNVPFYIEDETGRVEVNPEGCQVRAGTKQEGTPGQVGLMKIVNDSDEKWVEEVIVDGTLLYILGFAAAKRLEGPTLAEKKVAALRKLKRNPQDLQQFDRNGDGQIDRDEWDTARAAVEEKVLHESLQDKTKRKKQEELIVIGKKKGRPLIITETHSEESLTARYLYYSITLFIAAAVATGGAIYLALNYLKITHFS